MDEDTLAITFSAIVDESISRVELHAHLPFASATFNSNVEIRIAVNQQDLSVVPSQSGLHIAGRLTKADGCLLYTSDAADE